MSLIVYNLAIIDPDDDPKPYIDFLMKFFFRDEPLNHYLDLIKGDRRILESHARELFETADAVNLKAVYDGKLIGLCLNGVMERSAANHSEKPYGHEQLDLIMKLIGDVHEQANVFSKYPNVDKALNVQIISVDKTYRGQGMAKHLIVKTIELAKTHKCGIVVVACSSYYTELAVKRLGFEECSRIKFSGYNGLDAKPINLTAPNEYMSVYTLEISKQ